MSVVERDTTSVMDKIFQTRRQNAAAVTEAGQRLRATAEALQRLEAERTALLARVRDPDARKRLTALSQQAINASIASEMQNLRRLHSRFARATVNIGVVGRARQGKSRLLQTITGLSAQEIPDGSNSHCTGVRSTILHNSSKQSHAVVYFHTEQSFVSHILSPYYRDLNLGSAPQSIRQFSEAPPPPLPDDKGSSAVAAAKHEHLRNYFERLKEYGELIGQSPRTIPLADVRSYVAQDTIDGQRLFHQFLAVAQVQVTCHFPAHGVEQCGVIDMPGLGDTGIGDEDRLISVLAEDVDLILFVKMPKATGDFWSAEDVALYDLAERSVKDIPLENWSFMILNRTKEGPGASDNLTNCQLMAEDAPKKHIATAKSIIVDCSEPAAVQSEVFHAAVNYLSSRCEQLDQVYASASQQRLQSLQVSIQAYLERAQRALGSGSPVENELKKFDDLFEGAWTSLTTGLESLNADLRKSAAAPYVPLAQDVDQVISSARDHPPLPDLERIRQLAQQYGAYGTAFNACLHEVRTALSARFSQLEDTLHVSLDDVRNRVTEVLKESGLAGISSKPGKTFLLDIRKALVDDAPTLASAVETLASVDLTYRGFLQYRLRPHLMILHPDGMPNMQQVRVLPSPESVREALEVLYADALYRIETAFEAWFAEPNQVAAAMVDEFLDRVLRSQSARLEWRGLFLRFRSDVWKTAFDELGQQTRTRESWNAVVTQAIRANSQPLAVTRQVLS